MMAKERAMEQKIKELTEGLEQHEQRLEEGQDSLSKLRQDVDDEPDRPTLADFITLQTRYVVGLLFKIAASLRGLIC